MTARPARRARLRLTRRGRLVAASLLVAGVAAVAVAAGGPPGARGTRAAPAPASPSPSPSPAPVPWAAATPRPVGDDVPRLGDDLVAAAPVVVVADLGDRLDRDVATWLAARLQAPVVAAEPAGAADPGPRATPTPSAGTPTPAPAATRTPARERSPLVAAADVVVTVGDVEVDVPERGELRRVSREEAVSAPADTAMGPLQVRRAVTVAAREEPPVAVRTEEVRDLLATAQAATPSDVVLLVRPGGAAPATVATAVALGHRVVVTDATDPRADRPLRAALASAGNAPPVGLAGHGWDDVDPTAWAWKLRVAASGVELPGGGQLVYPGRLVVALYGHPVASSLGILGEQPLEETIALAGERATAYRDLVDVRVTPALEIIATVAAGAPGAHGDYSTRTAIEVLRPYVDAARAAGQFVILDLQPGRTDFLTQAKEYEELLREPHVGLALDPEWRLAPDERHLRTIGSVSGHEVNTVVTWLADLVRAEALPQKLLVLHQFKLSMLRDREVIDTSRDELTVVLHMDGQGGHATKLDTYATILRDAPAGLWVGWKNFRDEDTRMRTPAETMALDPQPVFVSYQ